MTSPVTLVIVTRLVPNSVLVAVVLIISVAIVKLLASIILLI